MTARLERLWDAALALDAAELELLLQRTQERVMQLREAAAPDHEQQPTSRPARVTRQVGWVTCERIRCGKQNCRCGRGELHGPYYYLNWREGRRHRRKYLGKQWGA